MTSLAYMVRSDWAQHGTGMVPQSAVIRTWLDPAPYPFAVFDVVKTNLKDRSGDFEPVKFIAPESSDRVLFGFDDLHRLNREDKVIERAVIAVHPHEDRHVEAIREAVEAGSIKRLFVMVWAGTDRIRTWLDGLGALNLHTNVVAPASDPIMLEAIKSIRNEEYNGLSHARGKDAVVQLVRAFAEEGYPVDVVLWLRAYFAGGGSFRHAESVAKLVKEMAGGTRHRVKPRYRDDIFDILRDRADSSATEVD